jgi:hypothetical protein
LAISALNFSLKSAPSFRNAFFFLIRLNSKLANNAVPQPGRNAGKH